MAALTGGAWDGLRLAGGIATLLIAVLGVVGVLDLLLGWIGSPLEETIGGPLSLERILTWIFIPFAWLLGIDPTDVDAAARLLGGRLVLTEVFAYRELGALAAAHALSPRTVVVLSYALCGFSHVASVGIFVGGIAAIAPSRRDDLAALGLRALAAATLATLMTGALAGIFYHGQTTLLGV
jgi:CNT family concentrative nucleoside transporter